MAHYLYRDCCHHRDEVISMAHYPRMGCCRGWAKAHDLAPASASVSVSVRLVRLQALRWPNPTQLSPAPHSTRLVPQVSLAPRSVEISAPLWDVRFPTVRDVTVA